MIEPLFSLRNFHRLLLIFLGWLRVIIVKLLLGAIIVVPLMPLLVCLLFFIALDFLLWCHYNRLNLISWWCDDIMLWDHGLLVKGWRIFWKSLEHFVIYLDFLASCSVFYDNLRLSIFLIWAHLFRRPLLTISSALWSVWFNASYWGLKWL